MSDPNPTPPLAAHSRAPAQWRSASADFEAYLKGGLNPKSAVEPVLSLLLNAPQQAAHVVASWAHRELEAAPRGTSISRLLHNGLQRVFRFEELGLVEPAVLRPAVMKTVNALWSFCPDGEARQLEDRILQLFQGSTGVASTHNAHRGGSERGKDRLPTYVQSALVSPPQATAPRRTPAPGPWPDAGPFPPAAAPPWYLADREPADRYIEDPEPDAPPLAEVVVTAAPEPQPPNAVLERQDERARCLVEVLNAAADCCNSGNLGTAAAIFHLAESLMRSGPLEEGLEERTREYAWTLLSPDRLQAFAADSKRHYQLRELMDFFPALQVQNLLTSLLKESDRRQRFFLLSLLQVRGDEARELASRLLVSSMRDQQEWAWFFVRNLLHLLRKIPPQGEPEDAEVLAVLQYSAPTQPPQLVCEAAAYIVDLDLDMGIELFKQRLGMLHLDQGPAAREASQLMLAELLRSRRSNIRAFALELVFADHDWPRSYATALRGLRRVDLRQEPETLARLVRGLTELLPGAAVGGPEDAVASLVRAVAGTPDPSVIAALHQVMTSGISAAVANEAKELRDRLESLSSRVGGNAKRGDLSGDLDLFGLSSLIRWLGDMEASGTLQLHGGSPDLEAELKLTRGRLGSCRVGGRSGIDAFYFLFEKPFPASFSFTAREEEDRSPGGLTLESMALEGTRRRHELEHLRLLVPDDAVVRARAAAPGAMPRFDGEQESEELISQVWDAAADGAARVSELEQRCVASPYRVRRLLHHWLEQGCVEL